MTEELHYRLPPASAYRLNRCLFALKSDNGFRARFLKDAAAALREYSLSDEDAAAIVRGDRDGLLVRGAHPIWSSRRTCGSGWSATRSHSSFSDGPLLERRTLPAQSLAATVQYVLLVHTGALVRSPPASRDQAGTSPGCRT